MSARNDDFADPAVFEYWRNLAETDPERFESERIALLENAISTGSREQQALGRSLQRKVDRELSEQKNFDGRMQHAFKMMADQFTDEERGFASIGGHFAEALEDVIDAQVILSQAQDQALGLQPKINAELLHIMQNGGKKPD